MASVYLRRKKWWMKLKELGRWKASPTPFGPGEREAAQKAADEAQRLIDKRERANKPAPETVAAYAARWLDEREARGLRSVRDDRGRVTNHVLPVLGPLLLADVRPRHIRDLVRELRAAGELAPRTVRHVYGVLHTMFHDAFVDELIEVNPCALKRGELPGKVDKDSEWRTAATYEIAEVVRLVSDPELLVERRVLYALKALAALRHGEAAGLRWRHYDAALKPLGRLVIATSYDTGRTKTEVTRRVPVHPALAKVLAAWRSTHWERIYGREPEQDDLIVPTRTMRPIAAAEAVHAFKADLEQLELRVDAGEHRDRGGHDLRAWMITTCQEHGAHRDLLRVITHPGKGDVVSGYTRATWPALCAEVAKLRIKLPRDPLKLGTRLGTREESAGKRWRKEATPTGFESDSKPPTVH